MLFRQLFDAESATYTYLLADQGEAVLIDPVRDQVERDLLLLEELGLKLVHTCETHVHADHVTSSGVLRQRLGSRSVVSKHGGANCADVLADQGDEVTFGGRKLQVRATPGHTSGCVTYVLDDESMAFTGDTLLIRGNGRTDFQEGDARTLYHSIHEQIFSLPDETLLYPGHDYRGFTCTTVGEEKAHNRRLGGGKTEAEFVAIMDALKLPNPKKIDEAVPANLRCGIPAADRVDGTADTERGWAPIVRREGIPEVTVAWTADHLDEFRLVDVRRQDEWDASHVEGADHVVLDVLESVARDWDRDAPLVVMCKSGGRSGKAARLLEGMGFLRVASMDGGITGWMGEGHAAVDGAGSRVAGSGGTKPECG